MQSKHEYKEKEVITQCELCSKLVPGRKLNKVGFFFLGGGGGCYYCVCGVYIQILDLAIDYLHWNYVFLRQPGQFYLFSHGINSWNPMNSRTEIGKLY